MKFPLKFTVTTQDGGTWERDEVNNNVWVPGPSIEVKVFAWEIVRSEEDAPKNIYLLFEDLRIYAPPGTFNYRNSVILPDGSAWEFNGEAQDSTNNPYFNPGLVTYHAIRVGSRT